MILSQQEKAELIEILIRGKAAFQDLGSDPNLPEKLQDLSALFGVLLDNIRAERFRLSQAYTLYRIRDISAEMEVQDIIGNRILVTDNNHAKWRAVKESLQGVSNVADRFQLRSRHCIAARPIHSNQSVEIRWYTRNTDSTSRLFVPSVRTVKSKNLRQDMQRTFSSYYSQMTNPFVLWRHLQNAQEISQFGSDDANSDVLMTVSQTMKHSIQSVLPERQSSTFELSLTAGQNENTTSTEDPETLAKTSEGDYEAVASCLRKLRTLLEPIWTKAEQQRVQNKGIARKLIGEWRQSYGEGAAKYLLSHMPKDHLEGKGGFLELHLEALRDQALRLRDISTGNSHKPGGAAFRDFVRDVNANETDLTLKRDPIKYSQEVRNELDILLERFPTSWGRSVTMSLVGFDPVDGFEESQKPDSVYRCSFSGTPTFESENGSGILIDPHPNDQVSFWCDGKSMHDNKSTIDRVAHLAKSKDLNADMSGLKSLLSRLREVEADQTGEELLSLLTKGDSLTNPGEVRSIISVVTRGFESWISKTRTGSQGKRKRGSQEEQGEISEHPSESF